jgi:beta-lactamase regulating signal transducer with metallopeptidase domain/LysM repeat protein
MDILENILSREVVHKLGWTLLHSLWQGGVIALLLVVLLRALRKSSANLRYVIACLGLTMIVLLPIVTFCIVPAPATMPDVESVPGFSAPITEKLYKVYDTDMSLQRAAEYMQIFPTISLKQRVMNYYSSALPYIVFSWFIGVLALCFWHLGGLVHLQRLKRQKVNLVDESLKERFLNLTERLKVTRPVKLMESALVQIPTVVGWFRPVILLPASALTGLSREQLEALLAHELAHIQRYDYLVNMFQTLVEILGFFNPAVWWISYTIRMERENCCDDLAVSVCGDKVGYARALTSMEEARLSQGELAVAASGGNLSRRICRLIGKSSGRNNRLGYTPVMISILLIMALMIPTTLALTARRENKDSSSVSPARSDSIKATDAYVAAGDQVNDYERDTVADLDETDIKTQILFDCKIYEVPVDEKFLKGKQKEDEIGQMIWLGKEYADSLEALSRENKNVKVLSAPRVIIIDGEEASVAVGAEVPYIAGYEKGGDADDKAKPIVKEAFAGLELKMKGETIESGLKLDLNINYGQLKPNFGVHKDDKGREIQVPVIERSEYATAVTAPTGETIVVGGLRSNEKSSTNLFLTITPSIVLPEKNPKLAQIEMGTSAVDSDPKHIVEFQDVKKEKNEADQRLAELQNLLKQDQDSRIALQVQALELQQKLHEIQMKLSELERKKGELESLSAVLASPKEAKSEEEPRYHTVRPGETLSLISKKYYGSENKWQKILDSNLKIITADGIRVGQKLVIPPLKTSEKEAETEHERLAAMAAKFAERGDFAKAIEHLENAIELAKAEKDYGIGIAIEKTDGLIRISQLLPDAPASGSSFRKGDIIKAIDGLSTGGMSLNEVVARIRGPKGTKVTLTVKSHSQDITMEETFTRQLPLKGSPVLQEYYWRLDAYEAGKTWPQYSEMMKNYKPLPEKAVRIFELKYVGAEELAKVLNRILERRWKGIKDEPKQIVKIVPDPGHKKLIILASPVEIQLIEALIAELDVLAKRDTAVIKAAPDTEYKQDPAADSTITQIIKLKHADCESVEQILQQILSDEHFKIAADKRTNMLIVAGRKSAIEEVKALVAEIDVMVPEKNLEVGESGKQDRKDF